MTTATSTEHKSFAAKSLSTEGEIEAVISTYGRDRDGDVMTRGAFRDSEAKAVPMVWSHDWSQPVGRGTVHVGEKGVTFRGKFFLDTIAGADAYKSVKAMGSLQEYSIGFRILEANFESMRDETGRSVQTRVIKHLELFEVSPVLVGAAIGTGTLAIKSAPTSDRWSLLETAIEPEDSFSAKALIKRGYDVQSGWLEHKGQRVYPAQVLDKPADTDSEDLVQLRKEATSTLQPAYSDAFWKLMKLAPLYGGARQAAGFLVIDEQKALSLGVDSSGGYLAPPEFRATIEANRAKTAVVRRYATIIPVGRDKLILPMAAANSTSPDVYSSDFVGDWYGEVPATWTSVDPDFQHFVAPIRKLRVPLTVSWDLWSDQPALSAFIAQDGGRNLALVEDAGFIAGNGLALQPRGMLNSGLTASDVSGSTADTISNTTSDAGSAPKLIDLVGGLPSQYRENGRWIMRGSVENKIRKLVGVDGAYLFPRTDGGMMQGSPVSYSDALDADGVDGNQVAIYGDIASYLIADRMSLIVDVLMERFAESDQVGVLLKSRSGGGLFRTNGIVIARV